MAARALGLTAPLATEVSGEASTAWFPEPSGEAPQQERPSGRAAGACRLCKATAALGVLALVLSASALGPQRRAMPPRPPGEASLELTRLHSRPSLAGAPFYTVDAPPAKFWQALRGAGANATGLPPAPERELGDGNCERLLNRFEKLGKQDMQGTARDPEFPDSLGSIAEAGASCGDSAAGIHKSCDKYNNWASFQDVSKRMHRHFEVMAGKGPEYHDVGQGELGTCYFLAALASIAHSDPKVIEKMFVRRDKWAHNVYTTRWLLDGKEAHVQVNNKVPAYHGQRPYFVQPSETGEWWPVILEKTWAKIFGNYKAVEGGMWENAVQAITMAPVVGYSHKDHSASEIFDRLAEATRRGWPMGAGTSDNCKKYGLAQGHAYSVLNASTSSKYGKVVTVYNPWNSDHYDGAVPNPDQGDGVFTMTIAEFHDAFRSTNIATVNDHYEIVSKQVQTEASKMTVWEFSVTSAEPFFVTLSWPGRRIVRPCRMANPTATLTVSVKGSKEPLATAPRAQGGVSSTSVEVTHGPGDYVVVAGLDFPPEDKVHEGHLTVYSASHVTLSQSSEDVSLALLRMFGPTNSAGEVCTVASLPNQGVFELDRDKLVHGFPTYWSADRADFAYWISAESKWYVITHKYFDQVKAGELWSFEKLSKDAMTCGCQDSANGVAGFNGIFCNNVKGSDAKFSNVKCSGSEYSQLVQRFCPETCGAAICSRATTLASPPARSGGSTTAAPTTSKATTSKATTSASPARSTEAPKQVCEDASNPGITLNDKGATCTELGPYCHEYPDIEAKCCATCARRAADGLVSNEQTCKDHPDASCSSLKDKCSSRSSVRERCCATCKGQSGVSDMLCSKSRLAFIQPKDGTEHELCSYLKPLCGLQPVTVECCATCGAVP